MHIRLIISCCFLILGNALVGQKLTEKVKGLTNFKEICQMAESHYENLEKNGQHLVAGDLKKKHFKRWEWYMRNRLNAKGELCDYKSKVIAAQGKLKKPTSGAEKSTLSDWEYIGPTDFPVNPTYQSSVGIGRIDRIALHPTNPNIIYVGAPAGGVWKTTDGGNTWNSLDNYLPILGVAGLAVGNSNPNLVYALSGNSYGIGNYPWASQGLFRSTNGGDTWEQMTMPASNFNAFELALSSSSDNRLAIATSNGVYLTANGGQNWTLVLSDNAPYHDVKFKPGTGFTMYASSFSGVEYTNNEGITWQDATFDAAPTQNGRKVLATSLNNPELVYVLAGPNTSVNAFAGFYRSFNSGADFTLRTTTPNIFGAPEESDDFDGQPFSCIALAAHPTNINTVVSGGLVPWRSTNGGAAWTQLNTYFNNGSTQDYIHVDFKDLEYNPLNGWLYGANDGGIYRSTDNGTSWENITVGIGVTQFYTIATFPTSYDRLIGGTQDNGAKHKIPGSTVWDELGGGDGFITAYDQFDFNKFYFSANNQLYRRSISAGGLTTIVPITPPSSDNGHAQVASRIGTPGGVYAGTRKDTLCYSPDSGTNWGCVALPADLCIATCPTNQNRLYVAGDWFTNPIISRTTDNGVNWTRIDSTGGLPDFTGANLYPTDVNVRSNNEFQLVVTISGFTAGQKVYYSGDGGTSFLNITGDLPNVPTHCAAYLSNGGILVGTDLGVFYKASYTANWVPFSNNLPQCHVSEMAINESQGIVTVSTYGRGVFRAALPDADCDPTITWTLPEVIEGHKYYEASDYIETKHVITTGGMGTQIFYQAGDYIELKEGFRALPSAEGVVEGKIAPCGTEIPGGN